MIPYHNDCQFLKTFIVQNFNDNDLIDYEQEIKNQERKIKTSRELEEEYKLEGNKFWNFLAEQVVLRESNLVNKH